MEYVDAKTGKTISNLMFEIVKSENFQNKLLSCGCGIDFILKESKEFIYTNNKRALSGREYLQYKCPNCGEFVEVFLSMS